MSAFTDAAVAADALSAKLKSIDGLQTQAAADAETAKVSAEIALQGFSDLATEISDLDAALKAAGLTQ